MPAVWHGLIERFGSRVPKLSNGDRIIAEGAAWIAHDGLRLMLSKPIEVIVADGSGRGTYLPLAAAGLKMPVENESISVDNRRFFCIDPRDGAAVFEFSKPRKAGLVQAADERETVCIGTLPVDAEARPFLERLECQLQIDHDYVAHATLKSLGRGEIARVEFHQLDFGLALPTQAQSSESSQLTIDENGEQAGASNTSHPDAVAPRVPNVALRSNISTKGDEWRAVPRDLIRNWQPFFFDVRSEEISQLQLDERNYYLPCSRCGRTNYLIRTEGPNEICRKYQCSEFRKNV
jgi:molecular chaperone DnaK